MPTSRLDLNILLSQIKYYRALLVGHGKVRVKPPQALQQRPCLCQHKQGENAQFGPSVEVTPPYTTRSREGSYISKKSTGRTHQVEPYEITHMDYCFLTKRIISKCAIDSITPSIKGTVAFSTFSFLPCWSRSFQEGVKQTGKSLLSPILLHITEYLQVSHETSMAGLLPSGIQPSPS